MSGLTDEERRLVVETAFAGVSHGLLRQVQEMMPALPLLVPDPQLQAVCRAILLVGLNQPTEAALVLADADSPEAAALRPFFSVVRSKQ